MLLSINGKFTMRKLKSSRCRKVSFLICNHSKFLGICQGTKGANLYLWYPLFQVEWDRYDQHGH